MKITALEAIPYAIPYTHPLKFASGEVHTADHILVRVHTDEGIIGVADAPPRPYTYGETQTSIKTVIEEVFAPQVIGMSPFDREKVHAVMHRTIHNQVAKGAVDIALWDVIGIALATPVHQLLGGWTDSMRVSHMLGFKPAEELLAEGERLGEAVGAGLDRVLQVHAEAVAVPQHPLEGGLVLRGGDDQDVPDPGEHQGAQRVVDHRLVVHRHQLFGDADRQRVQS